MPPGEPNTQTEEPNKGARAVLVKREAYHENSVSAHKNPAQRVTVPRELVTSVPYMQTGYERSTSNTNSQLRMVWYKFAACSLRQTIQLRKLRSPECLDHAVKAP